MWDRRGRECRDRNGLMLSLYRTALVGSQSSLAQLDVSGVAELGDGDDSVCAGC